MKTVQKNADKKKKLEQNSSISKEKRSERLKILNKEKKSENGKLVVQKRLNKVSSKCIKDSTAESSDESEAYCTIKYVDKISTCEVVKLTENSEIKRITYEIPPEIQYPIEDGLHFGHSLGEETNKNDYFVTVSETSDLHQFAPQQNIKSTLLSILKVLEKESMVSPNVLETLKEHCMQIRDEFTFNKFIQELMNARCSGEQSLPANKNFQMKADSEEEIENKAKQLAICEAKYIAKRLVKKKFSDVNKVIKMYKTLINYVKDKSAEKCEACAKLRRKVKKLNAMWVNFREQATQLKLRHKGLEKQVTQPRAGKLQKQNQKFQRKLKKETFGLSKNTPNQDDSALHHLSKSEHKLPEQVKALKLKETRDMIPSNDSFDLGGESSLCKRKSKSRERPKYAGNSSHKEKSNNSSPSFLEGKRKKENNLHASVLKKPRVTFLEMES